MTTETDRGFHERRAAQERTYAAEIGDNRSAIAHLALAELHAERALALAAGRETLHLKTGD